MSPDSALPSEYLSNLDSLLQFQARYTGSGSGSLTLPKRESSEGSPRSLEAKMGEHLLNLAELDRAYSVRAGHPEAGEGEDTGETELPAWFTSLMKDGEALSIQTPQASRSSVEASESNSPCSSGPHRIVETPQSLEHWVVAPGTSRGIKRGIKRERDDESLDPDKASRYSSNVASSPSERSTRSVGSATGIPGMKVPEKHRDCRVISSLKELRSTRRPQNLSEYTKAARKKDPVNTAPACSLGVSSNARTSSGSLRVLKPKTSISFEPLKAAKLEESVKDEESDVKTEPGVESHGDAVSIKKERGRRD